MYILRAVMPKIDFGPGSDSRTLSPTVLIVIGILVMIVIIIMAVRNRGQTGPGGGKSSGGGHRYFSIFTLHRITSSLGLTREQAKMLEYVLKTGGVSDPMHFIHAPKVLDRHFKRTFRLIERNSSNEEELNERLSILFATRNIIEANVGGVTATSTRQVPEKVPAVLTVGKANYPVQVISSRGDSLIVENPKSSSGNILRLSRGSKANLAFFTKSSKGFSVETRILGFTQSSSGPAVQLAHSGEIKRLSSRRFRRRETVITATFYMVQPQSGSKKLIVDKRRCSGDIMDISIGGCSIKTNVSVRIGQRIKIEFTRNDNTVIAALGEVLRIDRKGLGTIIHIKFLRVPRRSLNSINAMVYEYTEN